MTMHRIGLGVAVAVLAVGIARPARAQDALIVDGLYLSATRDPGARIGPAPQSLQVPLAGGGRYAVGAAAAIDRVTGQTYPLPLTATVLAVDPVRPRAFLSQMCNQTANTCEVVTWNILTGLSVPLTTMAYRNPAYVFDIDPVVRYAVDDDVLFVDRTPQNTFLAGTHAIHAVNATTGVSLRSDITTRPGSWDVLPDGSRIILGAEPFWTIDRPPSLDVVDVASGQLVAHGPGVVEHLQWEPTLQTIIGVDPSLAGVVAYDPALRPLGAVRVDWGCSVGWQVSAHTGRVYILSGGGWNYIGQYPTHLFSLEPGVGLLDVDLSSKAGVPLGACSTLKVLSPPGPPRAFAASVLGHDVSIRWQNVGKASHFVLDVGLAPGRTDLSVYLGPDSHASFAGVPSGTYYLRLRGGNEFGGGRPSQEVTLVVP